MIINDGKQRIMEKQPRIGMKREEEDLTEKKLWKIYLGWKKDFDVLWSTWCNTSSWLWNRIEQGNERTWRWFGQHS